MTSYIHNIPWTVKAYVYCREATELENFHGSISARKEKTNSKRFGKAYRKVYYSERQENRLIILTYQLLDDSFNNNNNGDLPNVINII